MLNNIYTLNEFKIKLEYISATDFFGDSISKIFVDDVPSSFLSYKCADDVIKARDEGYYLLYLQDLVVRDKSNVNIFIHELLKLLKYHEGKRVLVHNYKLNLSIQKEFSVIPDMCIMEDSMIISIICYSDNIKEAEYKMIKSTLAAFQHNNDILVIHSQDILDSQTFSCLCFINNRPIFYEFTVSDSLIKCLTKNTRPRNNTVIKCYSPFLSTNVLGMYELDDRLEALKCFKLFKKMMISNIPDI